MLGGAVAVICAFWWIFEPIPIPATSLIPIGLLPLFGVLTPKEIGPYGSPMVLLLLGGFILSTAMAKRSTFTSCGCHDKSFRRT